MSTETFPGLTAANQPALTHEMMAMAETIADLVVTRLQRLGAQPAEPSSDEPGRASRAEWLTAKEAARYLGMSTKAFYSAVERRQVPATHLGRRLRFNRRGLDVLLSRSAARRRGDRRPEPDVQPSSRVPSPGKESERW